MDRNGKSSRGLWRIRRSLKLQSQKKGPSGADGYDAITSEGLKVQIKANHSSSTIGFRGEADLLLVLKIESSAEWKEVYYGPFKPIKDQASYSKRDNKYTIPIAKFQGMAKQKS